MALIKCECGQEILDQALKCPRCGKERASTEIEKATNQIKDELSSIKFYLLGILIATVVIAIITILYYRDYCKAKKKLRDLQQEISEPYRY